MIKTRTTLRRVLPFFRNAARIPLASSKAFTKQRRHLCFEGADSMAQNMKNDLRNRLVWVDLEMTGLDVNKCHIIEMACLVTDSDLNVVAEAPNLIINQPEELLTEMDEWCTTHHTNSGLLAAVRDSKLSVQQAEYEMLAFVRKHTAPKVCPLAGNSIHMDKAFLEKYMPQFNGHLHYRIVDVSTIKELCRRWYPDEFKRASRKVSEHRARDDIMESIKELKYYRQTIFC